MPLVKVIKKIFGALTQGGGTVEVAGDLNFNSATTVNLNNSLIWNTPGKYILFDYTGTCTNFNNLSVATNIAGRTIISLEHDSVNKKIYVNIG